MSETLTWNGVTGDFNTASNWTPSVEPQSSDVVIIDSGIAELISGINPANGVTLEFNGTTASALLTQGTNVVFGNDFLVFQTMADSVGLIATSGTTTFEGTLVVGSSAALSTGSHEDFIISVDSDDSAGVGGNFINTGVIGVGPGGFFAFTNLVPETPFAPNGPPGEGVQLNLGNVYLLGGTLATFPSLPIESGTIYMENSSTAIISNAVASAIIDPLDNSEVIEIPQAPGFITDYSMEATIVNFQSGDKLVLDLGGGSTAETVGSVSFDSLNQILWIYDPSGNLIDDLDVAGSYAPDAFRFINTPETGSTDALGTIFLATCYAAGTRIATPEGEAAIEDLRIGDSVVTVSGQMRPIRWIGRRSYAGRFIAGNHHVLPVLIRAGALADDVPRRDLLVSPNHAMFIDGVLIPAIELVNGRSIVQLEHVDQVEYFHVELETHDVVLAEGAPAETFVDDASRGLFRNAGEYRELYPDGGPVPARYCAPRIEDGEELMVVRRRLALRAGGESKAAGPLEGCLDEVDRDRITGWARDQAAPDRPVRLRVLDNGVAIGQVVADRYRADLEADGIGAGRHAFELIMPGGLSPFVRHVIQVQRLEDGSELQRSPRVVAAARAA